MWLDVLPDASNALGMCNGSTHAILNKSCAAASFCSRMALIETSEETRDFLYFSSVVLLN